MAQEKLQNIIESVVDGLGYQLWGYEYRSYEESALLRIYIDAEQGVNVDDCGKVSRQLSAVFDVEDPIPVAYVLEVSSPGIDRVLFTPEQYAPYMGRTIKIRTRIPLDNRRNFRGTIHTVTDTDVTVEIDKELFEIPFDTIDRARLKTVD
jgi:ribosome maturation factor RimP